MVQHGLVKNELLSASSKPTTEFAQPPLRSKGGRPQREGTSLGVFVPIWPVITPASHPNLYPLAGDDRRLTLLKRGCANSVVVSSLLENAYRFLSFPMHLRHPRQTPVLTCTEGSFSYQRVSKGGTGHSPDPGKHRLNSDSSELDFGIRETKMVHFGPFWPKAAL